MVDEKIIVNFGCGNNKASDEIGVDVLHTSAVDMVCNLDHYPLPFTDNSIDEIRANHCFEHLRDLVALMTELHRVLKPGGIVDIRVPHVSNIGFFRDPTHKQPFTYGTFDYFIKDEKPVEYTLANFEYLHRELVFSKRGIRSRIGAFLYKLSPRRYEKYHTWKYPCYELFVRLKAVA